MMSSLLLNVVMEKIIFVTSKINLWTKSLQHGLYSKPQLIHIHPHVFPNLCDFLKKYILIFWRMFLCLYNEGQLGPKQY